MLSLFTLVSSINVFLVSLLNRAIDRIMAHEEHQQFLIWSSTRSQPVHCHSSDCFAHVDEKQSVLEATEHEDRLAALAHAHALLEVAGWTGAPLS